MKTAIRWLSIGWAVCVVGGPVVGHAYDHSRHFAVLSDYGNPVDAPAKVAAPPPPSPAVEAPPPAAPANPFPDDFGRNVPFFNAPPPPPPHPGILD